MSLFKIDLVSHLLMTGDSNLRYDRDPTQDTLIRAISISRQWSVYNLYDYAFDHFKRQFHDGRIHPAVVLGIAREYGIPDLIEPAVRALARPETPLASWSTDPKIIRYTTVEDIGTIGRMKEKLLMARIALCNAPSAVHDNATCCLKNRTRCSVSWTDFWASTVVPKLINMNGEINNQLWWIRTDSIAKAVIMGMMDKCAERTTSEVIGWPAWVAESRIPEGAVKILMVSERTMLGPRPEDTLDSTMS